MTHRAYRLLPALSALLLWATPAVAAEDELYARTLSLVRDRYLYLDEVDPVEAFQRAAEAAEDAVPWLIADTQGGTVTLRHGERGVFAVLTVDVGPAEALERLPAALGRLEDAIRAGGPIPPTVDLPITLLRGASRALDRHSVVLAKDRLERFDQRIRGKLTGVGARIRLREGKLRIDRVFPGSPAESGDLRQDDVVSRIDGVATLGMTLSQAIERIRGPRGTQVVLTIERGEPVQTLDVILTRDDVVIPTVTWARRPSGVGEIRIDHFSEHTAALLAQALDDFRDDPVSGIILDLRGNSGGSMIQACRSVDQFVESGVILRTEGRGGERVDNLLREFRAHPEEDEPTVPLVVLVDHKSASASEILAGGLSLLGRALLVGDDTHGKGTVQKLYTIRGGPADRRARLKLTVARYLLSDDTPIQAGIGLAPDVVVERARFSGAGASLPVDPSAVPLSVLWVDEKDGWRRGAPPPEPRDDFMADLADQLVRAAVSPALPDLLRAAESLLPSLQANEDARLRETFAARGIDWRPATAPGPAPQVQARVFTTEPARAGAPVELIAEITNEGTEPLSRVAVHLRGPDRRLPWHGALVPIGYVAPGETIRGALWADVDVDLPDRDDLITVSVSADQRPTVSMPSAPLQVIGRAAPTLDLTARLVPMDDGRLRAELVLRNEGPTNLLDVTARLALPQEPVVELVDQEANAGRLRPGGDARVDLFMTPTQDNLSAVDLEVRVSTAVHGRVLQLPLHLPVDGTPVHRQPPQVQASVPLVVAPGPLDLVLKASDDHALAAVTTWIDREKVGWTSVTGKRAQVPVSLDLDPGTHRLYVDVQDSDGAHTRREFAVRVVDGDAAADPTQ